MACMALAASSVVPMVTNAKPRGRPVSRSVTRWTSLTVPNCSHAVRTPSAVVLNERFPTYRRVFIAFLELLIARLAPGGYGKRPRPTGPHRMPALAVSGRSGRPRGPSRALRAGKSAPEGGPVTMGGAPGRGSRHHRPVGVRPPRVRPD